MESQNEAQENVIYTVKAGDTLYRIALEYGVTVRQLVEVNDIAQPRLIRLGQKIVIPKASTAVADSPQPFGMKYTVVSGDTLSEIALRYGVTVDQLVKTNQINDPNQIYIGQMLMLPLSTSFTQQEILSAGGGYAVGVQRDGTVVAAGWNEAGQGNVGSWSEIVSVSAGAYHTVGLKADGTVATTGSNLSGESTVADWQGIMAVSAGIGHTVGLNDEGTVIATGNNENGECNVQDWTDIVAVSAGSGYTLGLKSDGKVVATGKNDRNPIAVSGWTDIVAISAGDSHAIGLKSDGTVLVAGDNSYGQGNVSGWTGIIAVAAGAHHTVGLKSDGTVVATGYNQEGQCEVSGWKDMVAITAGGNTFGLRKDGTVAVAGENVWNQNDVLGWTNIGHYEAGSQEMAMSLQLSNLLGEHPDYLPTMVRLDPGYTYASATAERTEYGYFVTFYETKVPVPINAASLNNQSIARQVATFEAIVYVNKSAAAKAVAYHDAKQGFSPYAPTI
ncbi:MAG TPA: LysM peptidoglycan-binding domain-containing protein, partial [Trichococcus sp.]|nr:LysM peptidoglycan-binding domain-containing protein [Trichococcus sp.]